MKNNSKISKPCPISVCANYCSGPILCVQLAVGALTNFSKYEEFSDQLTYNALAQCIASVSSAQLDSGVKMDCLHLIYNLVTTFPPSQLKACEDGVVGALSKVLIKTVIIAPIKCFTSIYVRISL
jgi:hypothetical protein